MKSFLCIGFILSAFGAATQSAAYFAARQPGNCTFPINLLVLQDATGSMQEAFPGTAQVTLPALDATLPIDHPGSTFSLAIFKDKGIISLGEEGDECQEPLVLAADTPMAFETFYSEYIPNGGWDWPENQFGAIMALLNSPNSFPWTAAGYADIATNLIVMITDSAPHFEGDSAQANYPSLMPWGNGYDEEEAEAYCKQRYYPSPTVVRDALKSSNAYLGQIIISPEYLGGRALSAAKWFNSFLEQSDAFVLGNYEDTSNWLSEITSILDSLNLHECGLVSTTERPSTSELSSAATESATSSSSTPILTGAPPPTTAEAASDSALETEETAGETDLTEADQETSAEAGETTESLSTLEPSTLPVVSLETAETLLIDTIATLITGEPVPPTMPLVSAASLDTDVLGDITDEI